MSAPLRILGIGGSVRAESVNRRVLQLMLETAASMGAETVMADVHTMKLPIFNQYIPEEDQPRELFWLIEEMKRADGFIICSPTYLGSLSGAVKNTLDSLHLAHGDPRVYFDGRPVALASYGFFGQPNVINSLAFVTKVMGATVVPEHVVLTADEAIEQPDFSTDPVARQQLLTTITRLLAMARAFRDGSPLG